MGPLLDSWEAKDPGRKTAGVMDDWIYVQERDSENRTAPAVQQLEPIWVESDPDTVFMGLEYFCDEGDKCGIRPTRNSLISP